MKWMLVVGGIFCFLKLAAQPKVNWPIFADVTFIEEKIDDFGIRYQVPKFGDAISHYDQKEIIIGGYIIPQDGKNAFYVLSKNPFFACYFCGAAGPETVIALDMKLEAMKRYDMDQRLLFRGILHLNKDDFNRLPYILKEAEPVE